MIIQLTACIFEPHCDLWMFSELHFSAWNYSVSKLIALTVGTIFHGVVVLKVGMTL